MKRDRVPLAYTKILSEPTSTARTQDLFRHVTNSNFQKAHDKYDLNRKSSRVQAAGNKWVSPCASHAHIRL